MTEVSLQAMVNPQELHSAVSEVTEHSEHHLSVFVLEKGKNGRQKRETSSPSSPSPLLSSFPGNAISFKEMG